MFMLKGKEFTFDVGLSTMPCGFNAALYFVGMTANEGAAEKGTNYCDAQAVAGTFCSEMDRELSYSYLHMPCAPELRQLSYLYLIPAAFHTRGI